MLDRVSVWHLAGLALAVRLLALLVVPDPGFPDAAAYVESGRDLFETGHIRSPVVMPLYPVFVHLTGGGTATRLLEILISAATVVLVHRLTTAVLEDRRAGLVAAALTAIYPHFVFFSITGLTETLYIFVVVAAMLAYYRERYLAGSALVVLSILMRPALDLLAPLLVLAFALLVHRRSPGEAARRLVQYGALYLALMAPWWVHNYTKYDTFVRLSLADGDVLYRGNNPLNTSGGGVGGTEARDVDFDLSRFAGYRDPVARNDAMRRAAVDFIRDNPGRFLELAAIKFTRLWRPWPYARDYQSPWIIAASLSSYVPVMGLALYFLAVAGRRRLRRLAPILGYVAYLTLIHMATIGSVRYRVPMEPFVILLAGGGAARLVARVPWLSRRLFAAGG